VKFEAMFGPFDSSMRKTHSLIAALRKHQFTLYVQNIDLNCFTISTNSGQFIKLWNNPSKKFDEKFIIDEQGNCYECWELF
jgi:hypothetical protein